MTDLVVIDEKADTTVTTITVGDTNKLPRPDDHIWIDDNGDVAMWVKDIEWDYRTDDVRAVCERLERKPFIPP